MVCLRVFLKTVLLGGSVFLAACGGSSGGGDRAAGLYDGGIAGDAGAVAIEQIQVLAPQAALPGDIDNGVILTRLDVVVDIGASVEQINNALQAIGARIITSTPNSPFITVEVPRQSDTAGLGALAEKMRQQAGIVAVFIGQEPVPRIAPAYEDAGIAIDTVVTDYLQRSRFQAAWNAGGLMNDCLVDPVKLVIVDKFGSLGSLSASMQAAISKELPAYRLTGNVLPDGETHGWNVAAIAVADFSASSITGAMPFSDCVDLTLFSVSGLTQSQQLTAMATYLNSIAENDVVIVNYSLGFRDRCDSECTPLSIIDGSTLEDFRQITPPAERAWMALLWKGLTHLSWDNMLVVTASGDERDLVLAEPYPALADARFSSALSYVTIDDFISTVRSPAWGDDADPGAEYIQTSDTMLSSMRVTDELFGTNTVAAAKNVIIVGNDDLGASSDVFVDVSADAENVPSLEDNRNVSGSSFAAPQVAGLAAFLWALDDAGPRSLATAAETISQTRAAIVATAFSDANIVNRLDALAAVLSLDTNVSTEPPIAPVREAMLDFNNDGFFNQDDLILFANMAKLPDAPDPTTQTADSAYSRFDLLGVSAIGKLSGRGRFDLDAENSGRFTDPDYAGLILTIGAADLPLNESNIRNTQILCYYAYSTLYLGDDNTRGTLLPAGVCGSTEESIVFRRQSGYNDVVLMSRDGSNETVLSMGESALYGPLLVSPDRKQLLYVASVDNQGDIYKVNTDGSNWARLTDTAMDEREVAWSPDGKQIAFIARLIDANGSYALTDDIFVINADGSGLQNITLNITLDGERVYPAGELGWMAGGTRLFFRATSKTNGVTYDQYYTIKPDGSGLAVFPIPGFEIEFEGPRYVDKVVWSPDGQKYAFESCGPTGCLSSDPDGGLIYNGPQIFIGQLAGGEPVNITNQNAYQHYNLVWSPDSDKLAFIRALQNGSYPVIEDLFVVGSNGGAIVNLTSNSEAVNIQETGGWSSDSSAFVFVQDRDIFVAATDGSGIENITNNTSVIKLEPFFVK